MSQRERDVLKVMAPLLKGQRTQAEAGRLLKLTVRQVRRLQRRLEKEQDAGVVHKLRGKPSNRRLDPALRRAVLKLCREELAGFGPTLAWEKLKEKGHELSARTVHLWLVQEGLWQRKRRGCKHRSRRERKACAGEMLQADASEHDWLEGRGPRMVLVGLIDDATGRICVRFYEAETTEAYMDLLMRYLKQHGRPTSWYSDRDSIFRAEDQWGQAVPTQFSRALEELGIELKLARSPQAKGRIERLWGTLQDRWVKELRLAKIGTMEQANDLLEQKLIGQFNRRFTVKPASDNDAHRPLAKTHDLAAILSLQEKRTVANDYTIRLDNQLYQLLPPVWPGERGGQVIVERRLDGTMKIRLKQRYLPYQPLGALPPNGKAAPSLPRSLALEPIPAEQVEAKPSTKAKDPAVAGSSAVHRTAGCSGRTPAEPCPSGSRSCGRTKEAWRPAPNHAWRKPFRRPKPKQADISTCAN